MRLTEKHRKYILVGMVAFIIIGIFTAKILGSKQDEQFMYEDMLYGQANELYEQGNFIDAYALSNELLELQPRSEAVNYLGALIAAQVGEYKQAAILLHKAVDINPYKAEDAIFMIQFGEILFLAERYDEAKTVLARCQAWGWAPEQIPNYQERIAELLIQIENT